MGPLNIHKFSFFGLTVFLVISFFVFKCIYVAHDLKVGVMPDEITHLKVIEAFYNSSNFSVNPETLGPSNAAGISQDKFLYHLVLGKSAKILNLGPRAISFYRFWSILFSTLTVVFFYLICIRTFKQRAVQILALIIFSNILMFTATSVSISYDPLTNLISTILIWLIISSVDKPSIVKIYYLGIFLALGSITKTSILPFLPIALLVFIGQLFPLKEVFSHISGIISTPKKKILLATLVVCTGFSSTTAYQNYKDYGKILNVRCGNIFDPSECRQHSPLSKWYTKLREENKDKERVSIVKYASNWGNLMIDYTFGIAAHEFMLLSQAEKNIIKLLLLLGIIGLPFCYNKKFTKEMSIIFLSYFLIILIYVNYKSYLSHGDLGAGIHGRYMFPVLSAFIIIFTRSLQVLSNKIRMPNFLVILAATSFFAMDFPAYLNDENVLAFNNNIKHRKVKTTVYTSLKYGTKIHIDFVNDQLVDHQDSIFESSDGIRLKGWGFDENRMLPAKNILFNINDGAYRLAEYGIDRSDVGKAFNNERINHSGFLIDIDPELFSLDSSKINMAIQFDQDSIYYDIKTIYIIN